MSTAMAGSSGFATARRVNRSLTAAAEKRALTWMAERAPAWLTSDQLTMLGLIAQIGAGVFYGLARLNKYWLLGVIACIVLNWLGDSLDGTLARVRNQQRPRYGFYVDHMVDVLGATAMMCGLGLSGFVHWPVAIAMLVAFLLLSAESYLATYTLDCFQMSQGIFGPTEIRILLVAGNVALRSDCDRRRALSRPPPGGRRRDAQDRRCRKRRRRRQSAGGDGARDHGAAYGGFVSAGAAAVITRYEEP